MPPVLRRRTASAFISVSRSGLKSLTRMLVKRSYKYSDINRLLSTGVRRAFRVGAVFEVAATSAAAGR